MFFKIVLNLKAKKINLNSKSLQFFVLTFLLFEHINFKIHAEDNLLNNELEINHNNNSDGESSSDIPTNPFELVEMIRRANSMSDATKPSDAIDEAIKSFDMINNKESL